MERACAAHASTSRSARASDTFVIAGDDRTRLRPHHSCSSLAGRMPGAPASTLYRAAKSFPVKFLESLAAELWGSGVHVCVVCPGFTRSEFHAVMGTRAVVSKLPRFMWQDARSIAREGIAAVHRNETVYVTGPVNQLLASAVRVLTLFTPALARKMMRSQAGRYRSIPSRGNPA